MWKRAHKAVAPDRRPRAQRRRGRLRRVERFAVRPPSTSRNLPMHAPPADEVHAHMARWQALADVRRGAPLAADLRYRRSSTCCESRTATEVLDPLAWWAQQLSAPTGWDPAALQPLLVAAADWTAPGSAIVAQLLAGVAGPVPANGSARTRPPPAAVQRCLDLIKRIGVAGDAPARTRPTLRAWTADRARFAARRARSSKRCVPVIPTTRSGIRSRRLVTTRLRQLQRDALVASPDAADHDRQRASRRT